MKLPRFAHTRARRLVESPLDLQRVIEQAWRKQAAAGNARRLKPVLAELMTMLDLLKAWALSEYSGVSKANLLLIVGAVVYFLMPADLVPDIIVVFGFADDAAVIAWVVCAVKDELEKFKVWQATRRRTVREVAGAQRWRAASKRYLATHAAGEILPTNEEA